MAKNRHIIKKQLLEIEIADQSKANAIQIQFGAIFNQQLLPIINKTLDEMSPINTLHRIDRLEIDLGAIDLGAIDLEQFDSNLAARFQALLKSKLAGILRRGQQARDRKSTSIKSDQPHGHDSNVASPLAASLFSKEGQNITLDSARELWLHFMQIGQLPWWADAANLNILEASMTALIERDTAWLKGFLRKNLVNTSFQQRLFTSLPSNILAELISILLVNPSQTQEIARFLQQWLENLPRISQTLGVPSSKLQFESWRYLFSLILLHGETTITFADKQKGSSSQSKFEKGLLRQLIAHLANAFTPSTQAIVMAIQKSEWVKSLPSDWTEGLMVEKKKEGIKVEAPEYRQSDSSTIKQRPSSPLKEEDIYIENSGLVILWVYLSHFFSRLKLTEEKAFVDFAAQCRASWLLHYLATGQDEAPEFLLGLNKIMCGIPLQQPLEPQDSLTEEEKNDCEVLLSAIIENAPVLGKVSNDGFRQTFLLREGILRHQGDYWRLQVKRETHDILLDRLPWMFKYVKLPWMATTIYVEW